VVDLRHYFYGILHASLKSMKWLEEIRLRTQPRREEEVMAVLLEITDSVHENKGLKSAVAYFHQAQPGGFSLILGWDTVSVPMQGSDTGMLILEGLKPFGLLDRTVMVEAGTIKKVGNKKKEVI
jgi:hypothetical protein